MDCSKLHRINRAKKSNRTPQLPQRKSIMAYLLVLSLLITGCRELLRGTQAPQLQLDFAELLPAEWTLVDEWTEVNIDGDDLTEYLLRYMYDNGQVGVLIYDPQLDSEFVRVPAELLTPLPTPSLEPLPIPQQPTGFFIPYRVLPSYWTGAGQGFVAAPGQQDNIDVQTIAFGPEPEPADNGTALEDTRPKMLLLREGNHRLTFVWWKNVFEGYGVYQLRAAAGFRGIDWATWTQAPRPIEEIRGFDPLPREYTRSLLCRETLYRQHVQPIQRLSNQPWQGLAYGQEDLGIIFCNGTPAHPFYPEGVVLAYLKQGLDVERGDDVERARLGLVSPGFDATSIDIEIDYNRVRAERINDLYTRPTVPTPRFNQLTDPQSATPGDQFSVGTAVCVELAARADPSQRRWLVFHLIYQPPKLSIRQPDRWGISGVVREPIPVNPPRGRYCEEIVGRDGL